MATKDELLEMFKSLSLVERADFLKNTAEKVHLWRQENNGYVPREIFASCVGIGGVYPCVEMVIEIATEKGDWGGYALKKRGGNEQDWEGQYQIVGVAGLSTDSPADIFKRIEEEIHGPGGYPVERVPIFVGVEIHNEPERYATCWTLTYKLRVSRHEIKRFSGDWKIFTDVDSLEIVDHHRKTLRWVMSASPNEFVDLR